MSGRPLRCVHLCGCGAVLVCGDPDKCVAGEHWTCDACQLDQQDDYLSLDAHQLKLTSTQEHRS